jgi:4-amino-4-deoxy-L-arabinose transferase-like glycosyltransferase
VAAFALVIYTLALAPDVLYSDSAEFQTLAYTWGTSHPTGYPVYLLLARLIGIIPIGIPAWRISFVSALGAALTLDAVYLITRHFARRGGALVSSLVLMMGYTFWSQSIIAEVYTPATAFSAAALLTLLRWSDHQRHGLLLISGLLLGMGIGVHLSLLLIIPAALAFVHIIRWQHGGILLAGIGVGAAAFFLLFVWMDTLPTPTSFYNTTFYPSRDAWGLTEADFESPVQRFWMSVSGYQWRDAMLRPDLDYGQEVDRFIKEYLPRELTMPALLLGAFGLVVAAVSRPRKWMLLALGIVTVLAAALSYSPGDKYIFFLPAYVLFAPFIGIGADRLAALAGRWIPSTAVRQVLEGGVIIALLAVSIGPFFPTRWQAVQTGRSLFVTDRYPYPADDLNMPRVEAECAAASAPEPNAYLIMGWRVLYSTYYIAHVEQGRTGLDIREARPYGTDRITPSLLAEMDAALEANRPVYADQRYPELSGHDLEPANRCGPVTFFRVSRR